MRSRTSIFAPFVAAGLLTLAPPAMAQAAPPSAAGNTSSGAAPASTPPDVVRLKSGGMVRGTIITALSGEPVVIRLPDGTERRFEAAEVVYAGPAEASAQAAPPSPADAPARAGATVHTGEARLTLAGAQPNLTFHVKSRESWVSGHGGGSSGRYFAGRVVDYARLCTAPCEATLPAGSYRFGLSSNEGPVVETNAVTLRGNERLVGRYESKGHLRTTGAVIGIAGLVIGAALAVVPLATADSGEIPIVLPMIGTGVIILGGFVTIPMLGIPDSAKVDVAQSVVAARGPQSPAVVPTDRLASARHPVGPSWTLRF
jgi:hypothetical protein